MKYQKLVWSICCTVALIACGGGGGGGAANSGSSQGTPIVTGNPPQSTDSPASPAPPAATAPPPSAGSALSAENTCSVPNFKVDILRAINEARATARSCGTVAKPAVGSVVWNDVLFTASASHSKDMVARNYFAHTNPDGLSAGQRVTTAGYSFSITGENIAAGQVGIASVMSAWLGSAGHCNSIMNSRFVDVAVACVATNQAAYRTYWTMELAAPL